MSNAPAFLKKNLLPIAFFAQKAYGQSQQAQNPTGDYANWPLVGFVTAGTVGVLLCAATIACIYARRNRQGARVDTGLATHLVDGAGDEEAPRAPAPTNG
jgi:hypothetical protein